MKKITWTFILIFIFTSLSVSMVKACDIPPKVSADSAVVLDATTGELIYSKNPHKAYPPASTTKIMTALLTLEKTNLNDVVTIGKNPPEADGSKIYLFKGENLTVKELLYGLLLVSGNDCAEALAEHISGTTQEFAIEMNKRAKQLGCTDTNFVNPSGLYNKNHKTSAKDLALIMRELSKHPEYSKIATTLSYKMKPTNKSKEARPLWNENKLIQRYSKFYYKGCEGGKTGYTVQSKHSYVACTTKNNHRLIVALIHDKEKTFFKDAINLFNYGFNNYSLELLYPKNSYITTFSNKKLNIPLYSSKDFYCLKKKDALISPTISLSNKDISRESFRKNDIVTNCTIYINNEKLGVLPLKSSTNHEIIKLLGNNINKKFLSYKYIIPVVFILLFLIYISLYFYRLLIRKFRF